MNSGSEIMICCLFSNSSSVIGSLEINLPRPQTVWGCVIVGFYLVERGNGSWGVAAEAIASLDCGDDALEVSGVQQLGELQEAVAQHEQLGQTDNTGWLSLLSYLKQKYWHVKDADRQDRNVWKELIHILNVQYNLTKAQELKQLPLINVNFDFCVSVFQLQAIFGRTTDSYSHPEKSELFREKETNLMSRKSTGGFVLNTTFHCFSSAGARCSDVRFTKCSAHTLTSDKLLSVQWNAVRTMEKQTNSCFTKCTVRGASTDTSGFQRQRETFYGLKCAEMENEAM